MMCDKPEGFALQERRNAPDKSFFFFYFYFIPSESGKPFREGCVTCGFVRKTSE